MTIGGFVAFWLGSIVFSFAGAIVCTFAIAKEAADSGYKFKFDKDTSWNIPTPDGGLNSRLQIFVPGYNILSQFYNLITIKNNAGLAVTQCYALGLIEDMTPEEKEEYSKKPTGINAMIVGVESQFKKGEEEKKSKKSTDEAKAKRTDEIKKFKEALKNDTLNEDHYININKFEIHYTIVLEDGKKKLIFNEYKGDLANKTDAELQYVLLLCSIDAKSTLEYLDKLLTERDELKSKSTKKDASIKEKYADLRDDVLRAKEALEKNSEEEKKLTRK